jgi:hypothetical protein
MKIVAKEKDMCERTKGTMNTTTSEDNVNCKITRNFSTLNEFRSQKRNRKIKAFMILMMFMIS